MPKLSRSLKVLSQFSAVVAFVASHAPSVLAAPAVPAALPGTGTSGTGGITNPAIGALGDNVAEAQSGATFLSYFVTIWGALIGIGALAVILYFLWGALDWIYAGGDQGKIQKARNKITQAIIGMILLASSFIIIGFISQLFFGSAFNILSPTF